MEIGKKIIILMIFLYSLFVFTSCKKEVNVIETNTEALKNESSGLVTIEKVVTPTINFDEIFKDSKEIIESSEEIISTESEIENIEEETINILDVIVEEDDRVYHGTNDVDTDYWTYGMTPCEWVYIEPGVQIISNYKPNSSPKYSVKNKVSSGLKGCYIPIFGKTDMMSNEFDGRFYCFEDYKKIEPENMLFDNSLHVLKYRNMPVEDILRMGFDITKTQNGLLKVGNSYINIVYVTDLDKILNGIK